MIKTGPAYHGLERQGHLSYAPRNSQAGREVFALVLHRSPVPLTDHARAQAAEGTAARPALWAHRFTCPCGETCCACTVTGSNATPRSASPKSTPAENNIPVSDLDEERKLAHHQQQEQQRQRQKTKKKQESYATVTRDTRDQTRIPGRPDRKGIPRYSTEITDRGKPFMVNEIVGI